MKNFMKGIITFVFALMIMLPISVFAATEIKQADLEASAGGDTSKGITYEEGDFGIYKFAEGEYTLGEDIDLDNSVFEVDNANVTFDLNGKVLEADLSAIEVYGNSVVNIKGNGTINAPTSLSATAGSVINVENGTFNGYVKADGIVENNEAKYAYLNIKNGTFKSSIQLIYGNAVIDDGTFDTTESYSDAVYVWSGSSIEINGGTFKSNEYAAIMVEPMAGMNADPEAPVPNPKSITINGGSFTAPMNGLAVANVESATLTGGTFKATSEEAIGAISFIGEDATILTTILGEGCSYDPAIDAKVIEKWEMKYAVSQKEISVVNPNGKKGSDEIKVLEGADQTYTVGESEVATFRFSADYSLFENGGKVYMDDALVDAANYTSESGSTIIKLAKDYMNKLSSGEHTLKVEFNNGQTATTTFKVKGVSTTNPQTGDNIQSYVCVFFIGLMAIVSTLYLIKKSENK